ncbi:MAG: adenylosuccinate synthase [Bacteroidales bacterium]|nr:adenylosuccinate synthase [Bacteroidales bacterium]MBQ5539202.1 adenylosuccinate synthase [Bacteroidales bacterium]
MKIDVLLGLQWGDEGKGKIVDVLAPKYNIVTRFQGGPNAGHTLKFSGKKFVLHTVPSGIFTNGAINVIGNGVVLDPGIFKSEIDEIAKENPEITKCLKIAKRANLILPTHRILDAANEAAKGKSKIGSTLKGIGPAYTDKISRNGLRVGDILSPEFKKRFDALTSRHLREIESLGFKDFSLEEFTKGWFEGIECLKQFEFVDSEMFINEKLDENKSVLAEGAQGTMLDIDFGTYPFVTSSNTICAGACTGMGVAPQKIGEVYGIFKAYCTRVGAGPFPTELFDATGEELRSKGGEFGATTGRPRRTGWLDLVELKYSCMINGVTQLIVTKSDVMNGFDTIKACVAYEINGKQTMSMPFDSSEEAKPVYKEFKGWKTDISGAKTEKELPKELVDYLAFISNFVKVPIKMISVGPDRAATIVR